MKAKEDFEKKADLTLELDNLGIEYKKITSGASEGKATQPISELYELYVEFMNRASKPVFRKPISNFNTQTRRG